MSSNLYRCVTCGNLSSLIERGGGAMTCCGQPMVLLVPNLADAALEKHVPDVTFEADTMTIRVGSVAHPMEEAHRIDFVYVEGIRTKMSYAFEVGEVPEVTVAILSDEPVAVYAYCNLHGLWVTEV